MPEQDFELYLSLLGKLLKLKPEQVSSVRDELRDHLEARLEELTAAGMDRPRAIRQALDEFGDAALLAEDFSRLARERRRKRLLRWTLGSSVAAAVSLLLTFAFWPVAPEAPQGALVQADDPPPAAATVPVTAPPRLFLDAPAAGIDPVNFVPEPLRLPVGEQDITATIDELPGVLREHFGITVILDHGQLKAFGVTGETPCLLASHRPLYQALDRAFAQHDLDWLWDHNILRITTAEWAAQRLITVQYNVRELLGRATTTELLNAIEQATGSEDYAPWINVHGGGGSLVLLDDVLSVRQTRRGQLEVAALLAALSDPRPDLTIARSDSELALRQALASTEVDGRIERQPLRTIIEALSSSTGVPFGVDVTRLTEFGVGLDTPLALDVPPRPLGQVLELLLEQHDLTVVIRHGEFVVTTSEFANQLLQTAVFDVSDLVPDAQRMQLLIEMVESQTGNEDYGPWLNVHGAGGTISTVGAGRLVIHQTDRVLDEIRSVLRDLRVAAASRPAPQPKDPQAIETRYYRLPSAIAHELLTAVPRRIEAGSWNEPIDAVIDVHKGTLNVLTVGTFWKQYQGGLGGYGGFGGGALGGGGYGFGGGGLFQFGGPMSPSPDSPANLPQGASPSLPGGKAPVATGQQTTGGFPYDPLNQFDAVLIMRHRVAVHEQLTKWLNQVLFAQQDGHLGLLTVPTGVLPERPLGGSETPLQSQR